MKIVIFIIIAVLVVVFSSSRLPQCDKGTAKIAIAPRIFAEITIDGSGQNIYWTRLLHNKPGIFLSEFFRCYFGVFEPNAIFSTVGLFGLFGFMYFLYRSLISKKASVILLIIIFPLLSFFQVPFWMTITVYKLFAIIGLTLIFFFR